MQARSIVPSQSSSLHRPLIALTSCAMHLDAAADLAEQPAMLELQKTYGKTIHTWPIDTSPELPLGAPNIMMVYTRDGQGPPVSQVKARDDKYGMDSEKKRELRQGYLPKYEKLSDGADEWEETKKGHILEAKQCDIKW